MLLLLDHGAQVDLQDVTGGSPLIIASEYGDTTIVEEMLKHGPRLDIRNAFGLSPLNFASCNNHIEILKLLIEHGCKIDQNDIALADKCGQKEAARLLEGAKIVTEAAHKNITKLCDGIHNARRKHREFKQHKKEKKSLQNKIKKIEQQLENKTKKNQILKEKIKPQADTPSLKIQLKELKPLAHKWKDIGIHLDMDPLILDRIEVDYKMSNERLREMLKERLYMEIKPTWEEVFEAVEEVNKREAHRLRKKYSKKSKQTWVVIIGYMCLL